MQIPGAIGQVPETFNYQSPLGFRFFIKRLPNVNYFVNKINIPGVTLPAADEQTPFVVLPQPGDHVIFEPLVLTFLVDEGLNNYIELQKWLRTISDLQGGNAYEKLNKHPEWTGHGVKSEIVLSLLDSAKNAKVNVLFHDAWPSNLTSLQFDATHQDVPYLVATSVFKYSTYDFVDAP